MVVSTWRTLWNITTEGCHMSPFMVGKTAGGSMSVWAHTIDIIIEENIHVLFESLNQLKTNPNNKRRAHVFTKYDASMERSIPEEITQVSPK